MKFREWINEKEDSETGFEDFPRGWSQESIDKYAESLTGKTKSNPEGFFTVCVQKMQDEEGFNEERAKKFCAALKDEWLGTEEWRGED